MNTHHLLERANDLKLHGLVAHWETIGEQQWSFVEALIQWEEQQRHDRSLARRLQSARLGHFKPIADFDWSWPKVCDRHAIEALLSLDFLNTNTNLIFCGPNGVGKSTLARNIAHRAILQGHTVLFTTAGQMLNELASQDGDNALRRRLAHYVQPDLLVVDEVGYLSYSNRHADLLFEIISRRYQHKSTVITTNKPFAEWGDIFPNAACVVSLIDRLVHHSEIISIEAESFRLKEAKEQATLRQQARSKRKSNKEEEPF